MVREDILEGMKFAVSKGETLQQAMQSFFNAGYKKEEIEESARAFQMLQAGQPISQPTQPAPQPTEQQKEDKPQKLAIILLAIVLFLLLFTLVGVIIFKKDIVSFLTGKIVEMFS